MFDEYYEKSCNFLSFNLFEIQSFENIIHFTLIIIVRIKTREWPNNLCARLYVLSGTHFTIKFLVRRSVRVLFIIVITIVLTRAEPSLFLTYSRPQAKRFLDFVCSATFRRIYNTYADADCSEVLSLTWELFPGPPAFCKKAVERVGIEKNILNSGVKWNGKVGLKLYTLYIFVHCTYCTSSE